MHILNFNTTIFWSFLRYSFVTFQFLRRPELLKEIATEKHLFAVKQVSQQFPGDRRLPEVAGQA
jgi:hypothetical protein